MASSVSSSSTSWFSVNQGDTFSCLSQFYLDQEPKKNLLVDEKTRRFKTYTFKRIRDNFKKKDAFERVASKSIIPAHEGMRLRTIFLLFLEDCSALMAKYDKSDNWKVLKQSLFESYYQSRYSPKGDEKHELFKINCANFFKYFNEKSPQATELKEQFENWYALFSDDLDILEFSVKEIRESIVKSNKISFQQLSKIYVEGFDGARNHPLVNGNQLSVYVSANDLECAKESLISLTISQLSCLLKKGVKLLNEEYPQEAMGYNWLVDSERGDMIGLNPLLDRFPVEPERNLISSSLQPANKLKFGLTNYTSLAITHLKKSQIEEASKAFDILSSSYEGISHRTELYFGKQSNHISILTKEMSSHRYSKEAKQRIETRIKAHKTLQEIHEIVDYIFGLFLDLTNYERALPLAQPPKISKSKPAPQKIEEPATLHAPPNKKDKKKTKRKKPPPLVKSPKKSIEKEVETLKDIDENKFSETIQKVEPLPQHSLSGAVGHSHRILWRSLLPGWQELSQHLHTPKYSSVMKRLSACYLHSLLEQTLISKDVHLLQNEPTHNLWTLSQRVGKLKNRKLIADLYLGIHWGRYHKEWYEIWKKRTTLGGSCPRVLQLLNQSEAYQKSDSLLTTLAEEARSYHDAEFSSSVAAYRTRSAAKLTKTLEQLTEARTQVMELKVSSPWIAQWEEDIGDLIKLLELLEQEGSSESFVLLFSYALSLWHGSIQSPLYFLQEQNSGEHWKTHNLLFLSEDVGCKLSQEQSSFLSESIQGLSTIHRYPFQPQILSTAHRLFLEAISWQVDPFEGDAFHHNGNEMCLDLQLGRPKLRTQRTPDILCAELGEMITQSIHLLTLPLVTQVKTTIKAQE